MQSTCTVYCTSRNISLLYTVIDYFCDHYDVIGNGKNPQLTLRAISTNDDRFRVTSGVVFTAASIRRSTGIKLHCRTVAARRRASRSLLLLQPSYKVEVGQPIRSWLITFLLLIPYVRLWPWSLIFYSLTLNVCNNRLWSDLILYQIIPKSNNPRLSYSDVKIEN